MNQLLQFLSTVLNFSTDDFVNGETAMQTFRLFFLLCILLIVSTVYCMAQDAALQEQPATVEAQNKDAPQSDDALEKINLDDPSVANTPEFRGADEEEPEDSEIKNKTKRFYWFCSVPETEDHTYYHTVLLGNSRSTEHGIVLNNLSAQTLYKMNCPYVDCTAGIQQTENSNSFIANGTFWIMRYYHVLPDLRLKYRFGLSLFYDFQNLSGVSRQHNLYAGINSEMGAGKYIVFNICVLYGAKFSKIFSLQDEMPFLFNNDMGFGVTCSVRLPYRLILSMSISSYEDFYYPLFGAPTYTLGLSYTSKNRFQIKGEVAARYIDMFTLSSYLDCFWFRLMTGYTFK